ncbi:helix-turn-helix transcriptional regulator [Peterkaempfera sp. SMS 1(5)a]|uniref:helix-turn-helix transcriptional regulator n=1 Tax=Peterkaempfera podocarpi TaxID=3232308 RepID=UPI003672EEBD
MLTSLGLSQEADSVYRTMVTRPGATVGDVAAALGWTEGRVRRALDELADLELLRPSLTEDIGPRLVDPKVALEMLLARRQENLARQQHEIEAGRAAVAQLVATYTDLREQPAGPGLERLTRLEDVRHLLDDLGDQARVETLALAPGGPQTPENRRASRPVAERLLGRGVRVKTVYQTSLRNDQGSVAHANWLAERGAETRTIPTLPMRMQIVDREVAVVPIDPNDSSAGAVFIREPGALTGLCALFDQIWEQAEPFGAPTEDIGAPVIGPVHVELLRLLSMGLTDEAAARRLGVSLRTERRIISELMEQLGAQSRFQLGQRAKEQGLL